MVDPIDEEGPFDLDTFAELEELLTEALTEASPKRRRTDRQDLQHLEKLERKLHAKFTEPENWLAGKGVVLIHQESNTLLGTCREYTHKTVKECRKLVREDGPIAIERTEYVNGPGWIKEAEVQTVKVEAIKTALCGVKLECGVQADLVELRCSLVNGNGIGRAALAGATRFASVDGRVILYLPAELDILPGMTRESKIELKKELGL